MRAFRIAVVASLLTWSAVASPRDWVLRRFASPRLRSRVTAAPLRHRAVSPPKGGACPQGVIAQPVDATWLALAEDGTLFYADRSDGILRVSKSGGSPVRIAPLIGIEIELFALDATTIYFVTVDNDITGSIYSVPRSGGTPKLLAANLPAPIDLKIDGTSIYWLNLGTIMGEDVAADGSIEVMLKNGSGRQKLAGSLSAPAMFDIDDTGIFFAETGIGVGSSSSGLRRLPKAGGAVTKLVDGPPVFALALTATDVVYSGVGSDDLGVFRVPKTGGAPQTLFTGFLGLAIFIRDAVAYVAALDEGFDTAIVAVPVAGGAFRLIRTVDLDSFALALDDCAVYYGAELALQRTAR